MPTNETLAIVDEIRKNNSKFAFALFKVEGNAVVPDMEFPIGNLKAKGEEDYCRNFEHTVGRKLTQHFHLKYCAIFLIFCWLTKCTLLLYAHRMIICEGLAGVRKSAG